MVLKMLQFPGPITITFLSLLGFLKMLVKVAFKIYTVLYKSRDLSRSTKTFTLISASIFIIIQGIVAAADTW